MDRARCGRVPARLEEFRARLEESTEAIATARKAIIAYGDAVTEIARRAAPLKDELAVAQAAVNGVINDVSFGGHPGSRIDAEQQALIAVSTAATALKKLAVDRAAADEDLAVSLATAASAGWGDLDCTIDLVTGTRRDATNARVMDLFEHFRTGDERGAVLTDRDIFVQALKRSAHIAATREQVLADLRDGTLVPGGALRGDRSISDQPGVLVVDGINAVSSTLMGTVPDAVLGAQNLPESFLGSYRVQVRAGELRPDGGVEVTYLINNDTSIDSATRIPGTGGAHIPGLYGAMSEANAKDGEWATHHQTIVWTEMVYP
ncbi:hypothetical protein [Microbacterium sp. MMO-113]|uniref:hypothetical protein n=1 Tax=Microbacterium sp. MMO-113 TaxID=3081273 RepID=UPI0030192C50